MKNQKGITLVALVVTIIVLIILAGISINLTLGDNGIITTAQKAKENMELAKVEEERELNELYTQLETEESSSGNLPYESIVKLTEFKTAIASAIEEAGGIKPDTSAEISVFANNIKGIVKEVTKNATATASDIAKGKTAWVNGELITGMRNSNYEIELATSKGNTGYKVSSDAITIERDINNAIVVFSLSGGDNTSNGAETYITNISCTNTNATYEKIYYNQYLSNPAQNIYYSGGGACGIYNFHNLKSGDTISWQGYAGVASSVIMTVIALD